MKKTLLAIGLLLLMVTTAQAIPTLQIYIEGSTYDQASETWIYSGSGPFTLWVIGETEKTGGIDDVFLAAAVMSSESGTISLTPTTATGITDPSTPSNPGAGTFYGDGSVPVMGDGTVLPTHGIYGAGVSFWQFNLGDFTLMDSDIGDFIDNFPTDLGDKGQINAYTVNATGYSWIHFDAFDHVFDAKNHGDYFFAPFSHDGETEVPEPSTMILLGSGLLGLALLARKKRAS